MAMENRRSAEDTVSALLFFGLGKITGSANEVLAPVRNLFRSAPGSVQNVSDHAEIAQDSSGIPWKTRLHCRCAVASL